MTLVPTQQLARILRRALPNHRLHSAEPLTGGASNLSYLLRFGESNLRAVLRIYVRDPAACEKELQILRSASGTIPVPDVIHAEPRGDADSGPYILYHFVEGITFQELKETRNLQDMADASYAMGRALAQVAGVAPGSLPSRSISAETTNSPLLEQRLGRAATDELRAYLSGWLSRLRELNQNRALVHGDFNNRNTLIRRQGTRWIVSAILDWELAFAGCPLWDAARFLCYENPARPYREPHFSTGYCDAGGMLPRDWIDLARAINLLTAAEGLTRPDLPPAFIPGLCDLCRFVA